DESERSRDLESDRCEVEDGVRGRVVEEDLVDEREQGRRAVDDRKTPPPAPPLGREHEREMEEPRSHHALGEGVEAEERVRSVQVDGGDDEESGREGRDEHPDRSRTPGTEA